MLGLLGASSVRAEDEPSPPARAAPADEALRRTALLRVAQQRRASVLHVEVRAPGGLDSVRNAVVVSADGWLLMAGPTPGPKDTLVARTRPGTYVPAQVAARDPESALTLLQVLTADGALQPVALPEVVPGRPLPAPAAVGTPVVMITADGAAALGTLRAHDRRRPVVDGLRGATTEVPGLIEAGLATVAQDLGSPWFDEQGRLVGLLAGGVGLEGGPAGPAAPDLVLRAEPVAAQAVPAAVVGLLAPLLQSERQVRRARLGVRAEEGSEALLAQLCPSCGGQLLLEVEADGPAARGGLEPDDLIVGLGGAPLRRAAALSEALLPYRPLEPLKVTLVRRGTRLERTVVLGAR